jgi:hypothetical protein
MEANQRIYTHIHLIVQLYLHHQMYIKIYEVDSNLITGKRKEQNFILANLFIDEIEITYFNFRSKLVFTQCQQLSLLLINAEKKLWKRKVLCTRKYTLFHTTDFDK